jgi:hypothetical protein
MNPHPPIEKQLYRKLFGQKELAQAVSYQVSAVSSPELCIN